MQLQRVVYNLFEADAQVLDAKPDADFHEIDREIVLEGRSGERLYVSWEQWRDAEDWTYFRVAFRERSFFTPETPVVRDYSSHRFWRPLLKSEVELNFHDVDHTVLEVRGASGSVFVCTYEAGNWGADVLHIGSVAPPPAA